VYSAPATTFASVPATTAMPVPPGMRIVSAASRTAPGAATHVNPVVVATFYLMVVSFNFEIPDRSWSVGWEIPAMTAALFLASTVLGLRVCYDSLPGALSWFATFLLVYATSVLVNGWVGFIDVAHEFILIVQAMLVFWASFNLLRRPKIAIPIVWSLVISCFARAVLPMLGVGRTSYTVWTGGERVTAFGQNANWSAILMALGLVAVLGLTYGRRGSPPWQRLVAWALATVIGIAIVDTGSRGGLLALAAGLVALTFSPGGSLTGRVRNAIVTLLAIGLLGYAALNTEVMRNRLEDTAESGTLAGREQLFPSLVDMFLEKPVLGWGPLNNGYEVAIRATDLKRLHRDSHNLLLELLTAEGLVGTVPFLVGLALCGLAAWRGRVTHLGIVPFALLALFLVANMSANFIAFKPFYFALALAAASGRLARDSSRCAA
jgi:O-antigen ligase